MPRLVRNFRMLGHDIAAVFRLWWGEFARYVDFHGRTSRKSLAAFLAVCFAGFLATFDSLFFRVILYIVLAMPLAACCVRRLRDTDMSPWMAFAIPLLPFLLLVPTVKESDDVQPSGDDQSKESSNDIV